MLEMGEGKRVWCVLVSLLVGVAGCTGSYTPAYPSDGSPSRDTAPSGDVTLADAISAQSDGPTSPSSSSCAAGTWCLEKNPLSGVYGALMAVWGNSSTDVYAANSPSQVGKNSSVLHYDGSAWTETDSGSTANLRAVWGTKGTDIYVGGTGAFSSAPLARYNGSSWQPVALTNTPNVYGVWGSSASDIFVVGYEYFVGAGGVITGDSPTIRHFNGTSWQTMSAGTKSWLFGVWGSSSTNVFAIGMGAVFRYDGASWKTSGTGLGAMLFGVWGSSANDVFAVGDGGTIVHYDGASWKPMVSGTTKYLGGVWGSSATDVFAVGNDGTILHYDGFSWKPLSSGTTEHLRGVWGSSAGDVFVVGFNGTILHRRLSAGK